LTRAIDEWKSLTSDLAKASKDEAIAANTEEHYKETNRWTTIQQIFATIKRVIAFLVSLTLLARAFTESEIKAYVHCLHTVINAQRGGRAGAIAGL